MVAFLAIFTRTHLPLIVLPLIVPTLIVPALIVYPVVVLPLIVLPLVILPLLVLPLLVLLLIVPALIVYPGFIDFIPRFRALGEKCLVGHLDEQKATLLELLQRIHLNPTSERSLNKTNSTQSHGVVSVGGFIAPRVVGEW